jgi:cytochrome c-type biogenesis protein CcmF
MVFVPLMTPVLFLLGVGAMARWKSASAGDLARRLRWAAAVAVATGLAAPAAMGRWSLGVAFGMLLAGWIFASTAWNLIERVRGRGEHTRGRWARLRELPASYMGMLIAHAGVGVFVVGVTLVNGYETERDVRLAFGEQTELGGYTFRFVGVDEIEGPNYVAARGRIEVLREQGRPAPLLLPEKRFYPVQKQTMTEAAIDSGLVRDVYVALGEQVAADAWTVRVHLKPFVNWIWGGCLLMAIGGFIAICDRRYRRYRRTSPESQAPGAARAGALPLPEAAGGAPR